MALFLSDDPDERTGVWCKVLGILLVWVWVLFVAYAWFRNS